MVFRNRIDGDGPVASDARGEVLTHLSRHDDLFRAGYRYEAVAARALFVEAVLLVYVGVRRQADGLTVLPGAEKLLSSGRTTFGQLNAILGASDGFTDSKLQEDVEEYVRLRNVLTHRFLAHFGEVDLAQMHALGHSVVARLWVYVRERLPSDPNSRAP